MFWEASLEAFSKALPFVNIFAAWRKCVQLFYDVLWYIAELAAELRTSKLVRTTLLGLIFANGKSILRQTYGMKMMQLPFRNSWEKPCKQVHWNSFFMLGPKCEIIPVSHPLSDCVLDSFVCSGTTLCLNDWPRSVDAVVVIVITIIIMILEVAEKQTWARENSVLCRRQTKVRKWGLCLSPFHILKTLLDPSKTWEMRNWQKGMSY